MAVTFDRVDRIRQLESKATFRERVGAHPWPDEPVRRPSPVEVIAWLREHIPGVEVLPWFREVIETLYGESPSQTVVSVARGNGKTTLAAALAVYELMGRGIEGAQILFVATTAEQAANGYDAAIKLIHRSEQLTSWSERKWHVGYERRYVPHIEGYMAALPARDEGSLQGYTPLLAIVDEMGFIEEHAWAAMAQAATKSSLSRVLGIGTPGPRKSGTMYQLRTIARERSPRGLRYREWAAPDDCDLRDESAWAAANPAMSSGIKPRDQIAEAVDTTPEDEFRRYQLGQWVAPGSRWLKWGPFERLRDDVPPPAPGERVTLGFDGSASGDSTALAWSTREAVGIVRVWERIEDPGYQVPRRQVVEAILAAFEQWDVRMIAVDPAGWRSELEEIEREVGSNRIKRVNFNGFREFAPACDRFYQAVSSGSLGWDGSEVLSRHLHNATPVETPQGRAFAKPYLSSRERIDAAVAAVIAYEQASRLLLPEAPVAELRIW